MGGELNWTALPLICASYGVADIVTFAERIALFRDYQRQLRE